MIIRRYQTPLNRQQEMLLPARVDEYVGKNNMVRAVDAYVSTLDMEDLGFQHTQSGIMAGQPPYNPLALLKLYLYGYLQGIRSSRKLEREALRNLEVIWLIEGLRPTYKTIARVPLKKSLLSDSGVHPSRGYRGKTLSKCSLITYKLRFFDCFCLALISPWNSSEAP